MCTAPRRAQGGGGHDEGLSAHPTPPCLYRCCTAPCTACTADGRKAVVGTMKGKCRFYSIECGTQLEYEAQLGEWKAEWWLSGMYVK